MIMLAPVITAYEHAMTEARNERNCVRCNIRLAGTLAYPLVARVPVAVAGT